MVSSRVQRLLQAGPFLVEAHFDCARNQFHPVINPDGYINFGTAENHLLWDLLAPKINEAQCQIEKVIHYDLLFGSVSFRTAVAKFLERHSANVQVDPDSLIVASGSSAAIELLIYSLCEPGDGVLIPAPYYAGFDFDLTARCGAVAIPIGLKSTEQFALSVGDVQRAFLDATKRGNRPRVLLLTSPNNPLGHIYPEQLLRDLVAFCESVGLECIFDEVYANSCFGKQKFVSSLSFANSVVHTVYSFAKDFALSGFKVGVAHSRNPDVLKAMRSLCYFSPVSTHAQHVLTHLLSQEEWLANLISTNNDRLRAAYRFVKSALSRYAIPYFESDAGLFLLIDLRSKLESASFESELELWRRLFYDGKLNTSPGSVFRCAEPGFFRICFAHPEPLLQHGVVRLQNVLRLVPERIFQ